MDATASSLLASIQQGADYRGLYSRFSSYLGPFSDLIPLDSHDPSLKQKPPPKRKKPQTASASARTLAKKFLSFICKTLNLLPTLLRETSNGDRIEERDDELLGIYALVLDCLGCLLPVLEAEPYMLHLHRGVFVRCMAATGKYEEAEAEAVVLIEELRSVLAPARKVARSKKGNGIIPEAWVFLPDPKNVGNDGSRITTLAIDIIVSLCNCVFNSSSKKSEAYLRILTLVEEVQLWIRLLDQDAAKRNRLRFLRPLYTCAAFLTRECRSFDYDLVSRFCTTMLRECAKCSLDQLTISARKICSQIDLNWDGGSSIFLDVLRITLEQSLLECKDQGAKCVKEFLNFVSSASDIVSDAERKICKLASDTLNEHAQQFVKPVGLILSVYSIALYFKSTIPFSQTGENIAISSYATILGCQKELQSLSTSIETLSGYFSEKVGGGDASVLFLAYLDALEFSCQVLLPCAKARWSHFSSEGKDFPNSSNFRNIFNVLQEFCSSAIDAFRSTTKINEVDKERTDRKHRLLLESLISGFRICFFYAIPYEKCCNSINIVLSCEWVSTAQLKYFVSSLYNTVQALCKIGNHVNQTPVTLALKLYSEAVWARTRQICYNHSATSKVISNDRLNNIKEAVSDGYKRIGSVILLFHESYPGEITSIADITVRTFSELSFIEEMHRIKSNSFFLVKEWVKVLCKEFNDGDKQYDVPFLYHLLMKKKKDKQKWSRKSLGRILEKELLVYQHLEGRYPNLCKVMQEKVIKVLLEDLYCEKDSFLERSRILVRKARALRAGGVDGLRGSRDCLSEAISLLRDAKSDTCKDQVLVYSQLATAHCLHAQCAQEDKLDFEVILGDIDAALDLWLRTDIEHYTCDDGDFELVATNMVPMLCSLIDLLSIKGCYKHHSRICKLMVKTFERESIPIEKLFSMLCTDRRLGHTHCGVQLDMEFISDALQNFGASAHLIEFWTSCLEGRNSSLSMFSQSLLLSLVFPEMNQKGFEKTFGCKIGIKEIKEIASSLISDSNPSIRSAFVAGYLYYDLSQRLMSEGQLFEALSYAKEAFNLRRKFLHREFVYSLKKPYDARLEVQDSVATETWPDVNRADTIMDSFLSPWIVLRCYLESTFQVGSIHESIGNSSEAELMFRKGKEFSHLHVLHFFEITFASSLGQLYRKEQLWDMADSELRSAQKLLQENTPVLSCESCNIYLETTVNLQLGDLLHSRFEKSSQNQSRHALEDALCMFQSAVDKLDHHELELSKIEEAATNEQQDSTCKFCTLLDQPTGSVLNKKSSRNCMKQLNSDAKRPMRTTRSKSSKTSSATETKEPVIETNNSKKPRKKPGLKCNTDGVSYKRVCWGCLMNRALESGSLTNLIRFGLEFRRSSFVLLLRLKIARILQDQGAKANVHEIHNLYWKCISALFFRSLGVESEIHAPQFMELIADEQWKSLPISRALILYNMSLFLLKNGLFVQYSDPCCSLANVKMQDVVTWLLRAFIFSREFPLLQQKVSRLLACTLILSTVDSSVPLPLHLDKSLSLNHWASYFHQASISTSLDALYQSSLNNMANVKGGVEEADNDNSKFLRLSFENVNQLEEHVGCFFKNLPGVPIICISMIGGDYACLLEETLILPSFCPAWIMLSKIDSTNQPITMLLPANKVREAQHDLKICKELSNIQQIKEWQCPWGHTVMDHVAPTFKLLMEENILSSYETVKQKYWEWRLEINNRLGTLLSTIDDSWLGPWSCLLSGYPVTNQKRELLVSTLISHLESLIKSQVNPSIVNAILGGSNSLEDAKVCVSQLITYGGLFGHGGFCGKDRFRSFSASRDLGSKIPESIVKVLKDAFCGPVPHNREPVIFVLDTDVQMLPWESLPRLRSQEVYRMPSIGSIFLTLDRNYQIVRERESQELFFSTSYFPKVDPFDTYYLLNPGGDLDLKETEDDLKPWLEGFNFEGKTRVAPTSEELGLVLKNHDMFFYFGHGNGTQYVSTYEIEKLEVRAAALLMGCSSGVLKCKGRYAPQGVPLSYLFAGSPAVVANLWDITDREINIFSKEVVNSWLQDKEAAQPVSCSHCALLEEPARGRGKKTRANGGESNRRWCKACCTRRIASGIGKARDTCKLKMLTGAAPVCYGVPTILRRKG